MKKLMRKTTEQAGKNMTVEEVHSALAKALEDQSFSDSVEDRRIMWTVDGNKVSTYFRVND